MAASRDAERLQVAGGSFGLELDEGQAALMLAYLDALLEENTRINLTGIRERNAAIERHLVDSLAFALHLTAHEEHDPPACIIDLGTGGGFPGVPVAVALPATTVLLVESRQRKLDAVLRLCRACGIENVQGVAGRMRQLVFRGAFRGHMADLVLARAVGDLSGLIREAAGALVEGGVLLAWKSARLAAKERDSGAREAQRRGLEPLPDLTYVTDRKNLIVRYMKRGARHEG